MFVPDVLLHGSRFTISRNPLQSPKFFVQVCRQLLLEFAMVVISTHRASRMWTCSSARKDHPRLSKVALHSLYLSILINLVCFGVARKVCNCCLPLLAALSCSTGVVLVRNR